MSETRVGSVLSHLRRPHTQADDPDTHALLDLGVGLMLEPQTEVTTDLTQRVPQLRWPTREELVRAYNHRTGLRRSKAIVEDRWVRMADFHRDLVAWVVQRVESSTTQAQMDHVAEARGGMPVSTPEAYRIAAAAVHRMLGEEAFPLWAMFTSLAATDPALNAMMRQARSDDHERWAKLADDHYAAAGREPLPGIDSGDIAEAVNAMSYGLALRYLTDPDAFGNDPLRAGTLFAQASLALIDSLLTPPTPADAVPTMGQAVLSMPLAAAG
ncbi:TetR family transcriptional regulator C-terminal domain-containing protein [Jiangella endophytica]|uniref:TetR family transcriptional regulator C-terminal domain-containing protein n=1 Tax=Jiangella endophytica TaxID=1623398 RepID=UPI000E34F292|nr:TetR family transcriptional regulator C-terminal domain-containing protein [Jiangella endophytica]